MLNRVLIILLLLTGPHAWSQETPAPAEPASAEEIERVIATLDSTENREKLLEDLSVMLEARRAAAEKVALEPTDIVVWVRDKALALWQSVVDVNPVSLAISLSLSIAVLIGALLVRVLLLRPIESLYRRLYSGRDTSGKATAPATGRRAHAEGVGTAPPDTLPAMVPRLVNLMVIIVALVLLAGCWGADLSAIFASDAGSRLINMLFSIAVILVSTTLLWHAADPLVDRVLGLYSRHMDPARRERRMNTLVPLICTVLRTALGTIAVLLVLSELGINIAPLLAGAGILGLAVGFGAQTLVRDLITGVIILMEDSASAGDIIETGEHIGLVEEMRIRVMQLRDLQGIVHIIPYSEVTWIKNHTMDFSCYVFDLGVAYRENTDEVIDVLIKLGQEFEKEEPYSEYILEPLEIFGVDTFGDSAVVIKARYQTAPGQQWTVGRAFNARIKQRFDELNIEIPFPHTTLYFGAMKDGTAPPLPLPAGRNRLTANGENSPVS